MAVSIHFKAPSGATEHWHTFGLSSLTGLGFPFDPDPTVENGGPRAAVPAGTTELPTIPHNKLGTELVYDAFGISSLPVDPPATFHYATALETIGTLANLLIRGGVHREFVDHIDCELTESRAFLDNAVLRNYGAAEAYSSSEPWCDWFFGEGVLDQTVLLGNQNEWWLLAVTGTD